MRFFVTLILILLSWPASAQARWIAAWGASPTAAGPAKIGNTTVREIVHLTHGGTEVRIRLSNTYGDQPLAIGAVSIARRQAGASIAPDTLHKLTFSGHATITIPPGAEALSDAVALSVPADSDLAVSIYVPGTVSGATDHPWQRDAVYQADGDQTRAHDLPVASNGGNAPWLWLTGVDVLASGASSSIVAFGDSITDGAGTTREKNGDWPDRLAARLRATHKSVAVVNAGIGGDRLLHDGTWSGFGVNALARFDRDVLAQPGVTSVIVLLGINDIGQVGANAPQSEDVSVDDVTAALAQIAERAHEHGLHAYVGTLTPIEPATIQNYYSPAKDQKRAAVNAWIRSNRLFDGVVDFDKAVRDPQHPLRMLPAYDSGDHLHPSDAGDQAMANAVNLSWLK